MTVTLLNTVYAPLHIGGADRSVRFLAEALSARGHNVSVITLHPAPMPPPTPINGVTVHYLPLRNLAWPYGKGSLPPWLGACWHAIDTWNPFAIGDIDAALAATAPDVLHTNAISGFSCAVWSRARRRGIPVVHTLRDYYLLHPNNTLFASAERYEAVPPVARLLAAPRKRATRHVRVVVGNSRYTLVRHLRDGYFPEAAAHEVIGNIYEPPPQAQAARGAGSDGVVTFGYIGRLDPSKGLELLIAAFPEGAGARLRIAGSGTPDYLRYLQHLAVGKPVDFLGFQGPETFFTAVDVVVVPSIWQEPLPRVIFEAYAFGRPVIGSRRGGIPEMVDEGRTGWLFDPSEDGALARLLETVCQQPAALTAMAPAAREAAQGYRADVIAARYEAAYAKALEA